MKKWIIAKYIRLSNADQDVRKKEKEESDSISHQRVMIQNYIEAHEDLRDCEQREYFDDGFSGTNFERPGFMRMMEAIKRGEVTCVIVKDFSRFGRDYIELGDYMEQIFPFVGVRFISINDHYDSKDYKGTTGGLDIAMKNIVYAYYSRDLSAKVKTAKRMKMKRGEVSNGKFPYGYMLDPADHNKLIVDAEAASVVREIYDLYLSGHNMTEIARELNGKGYESPQVYRKRRFGVQDFGKSSEKPHWGIDAVRRTLRNREYYGAVVSHRCERTQIGKSAVRLIPEEDQIIVEGTHEGIVSKEEFDRVQQIMAENKPGNWNKVDYPLAGKVKCGTCGRSCSSCYRKVRTSRIRCFYCRHAVEQAGEDRCSGDLIEEEVLHRILLEELKILIELAEAEKLSLEKSMTEPDSGEKELLREYEEKSVRKKKLMSGIQHLAEKYWADKIPKEVFLKKKDELSAKVKKTDTELKTLEVQIRELSAARDDSYRKGLDNLCSISGITEFTKKIADLFLDKILLYDKEHVEIRWKIPGTQLKKLEER